MLYIIIGMSIFFVLMVVWAFRQDKKEKKDQKVCEKVLTNHEKYVIINM